MLIGDSGGDDGLFAASQSAMHATGSTVSGDAQALQGDMSTFWSNFGFAVGSLPVCLQKTLNAYQQAQQKPYADCVQHRTAMGSALQQSGTLVEAVDACCAAAFTDPTLANVSITDLLAGH